MGALGELIVAMGVAACASALACMLVIAARISDVPDAVRKGHRIPTPTSGGIAIGIGTVCGVTLLCVPVLPAWSLTLAPTDVTRMAAALAIALVALSIGLIDDIKPLGPRFKFGAFALLSLAAPILVGSADALPIGLGFTLKLGLVVGILGSALWMFTIINTVNFMDGANGLAMGSTAVGLLGLGAVSLTALAPHAAALSFCAGGGLIGFLVWNFPNGKVFAGDSGALFVGALIAVTSLLAIDEGGISPFIPVILFFPLLADVLLTLAWRVRYRSNVLAGHRDHLYQIAIRAGLKHWQVSVLYWVLCFKCALIAFVAAQAPAAAPSTATLDAAGAAAPMTRAFVQGAAGIASLTTFIAFVVLVGVALQVSASVRRFAKARGHDAD